MKQLLIMIFFGFSIMVRAQVSVKINNIYTKDGALGMIIGLTNTSSDSLSLEISSSDYLLQLSDATMKLDSAINASSPVGFVVFYANGSVISEPVPICSSRTFANKQLGLKPGETYRHKYETRCLGETTLKMLNSGKKVKAVFYMLHRAKGQISVDKSAMTRIKVPR